MQEYINKGNANAILTALENGQISDEVAIIALYQASGNSGVDPGDVAGMFRKMSGGNERKHLDTFFGLFQNYGQPKATEANEPETPTAEQSPSSEPSFITALPVGYDESCVTYDPNTGQTKYTDPNTGYEYTLIV